MEFKKIRLVNTVVACPIVYGSMAFYLGKRADELATHRWSLYLRGPNDEDLSCFISKAIFHLHPSFPIPVRELTTMPFEVTEIGWGEFEASIKIFFRDPEEEPILLFHQIKLYPPGPPQPLTTKKPVVSERYDEIIFTNPTEYFYKLLMMYVPPTNRIPNPNAEHFTLFDEERDVTVLTTIHDQLAAQTEFAKNRLLQLDGELAFYHDLIQSAKQLNPAIPPPSVTPVNLSSTETKLATKPRPANRTKRPSKKDMNSTITTSVGIGGTNIGTSSGSSMIPSYAPMSYMLSNQGSGMSAHSSVASNMADMSNSNSQSNHTLGQNSVLSQSNSNSMTSSASNDSIMTDN